MRPRPVTAPVSIPRTDWSGHRAAGLRTAGQRPAGQRPGQRQRPVTGHRSAGQPVSRSAGQPVSRSAGQPVAGQPIGRSTDRRSTAGQRPVTGHPPVIHLSSTGSWSPTGHPRRRDSLMNEYDSDGESAEVLSTTFQTSSCW